MVIVVVFTYGIIRVGTVAIVVVIGIVVGVAIVIYVVTGDIDTAAGIVIVGGVVLIIYRIVVADVAVGVIDEADHEQCNH